MPAEVFSAGLAQSMKAFHAEPIKRDLDQNQTLSCPGNPCLESVIHWLNQVCRWWGGGGEGATGKGEGAAALECLASESSREEGTGL